jgi:hypothetical protein
LSSQRSRFFAHSRGRERARGFAGAAAEPSNQSRLEAKIKSDAGRVSTPAATPTRPSAATISAPACRILGQIVVPSDSANWLRLRQPPGVVAEPSVSPFAKIQAIASLYFSQFDPRIRSGHR